MINKLNVCDLGIYFFINKGAFNIIYMYIMYTSLPDSGRESKPQLLEQKADSNSTNAAMGQSIGLIFCVFSKEIKLKHIIAAYYR